MARQPYYPYSPNSQAPEAGDGANDYENLFRATKAGPYPGPNGVGMQPPPPDPMPAPAPVQPPQPMYGGPLMPPKGSPTGKTPILPNGPIFNQAQTNTFDPSSDAPTASPAQPANPALPGPSSPAPSAPAAPTAPTTGWQTPGSGDTGNDWLGFLQQFLGRNMVSRGGSQGGYFEGGNQYRGNLQAVVDAYNQAKGAHAAVAGDDKIDFGDGRGPQDVITGAGDFWYGGPPGSLQPGSGGAGGNVGSVGSNGMLTGSVDAGGGGDLSGGYRQAILNALKQFGTPTDLNSPTLQPQLSAARLANQRGTDRVRKALAERAFAGGTLHSSEYDQQTQQALEHAGEAETGTEAGIVGQAEQQRLSMLRQLLGQGNQYLTDQQRMALQQELAGGQLGYQYAALQNSMNRDALLAQLGYYGG